MFPPFIHPYRLPYYKYPTSNYYNYKKKENSITENNSTNNTVKSSNSSISIGPLYFNPNSLKDNSNPVFNIFGINLFLDDIIIIGLLIFLYQENTKDEMLYIILFLLLFS